jgi:hypothetical protein
MRTIENQHSSRRTTEKLPKASVNQGLMNDLVSLSVAFSQINSFPKVLMTMR